MALVRLSELLGAARDGGYAIGYFEAWDTYSLEAVAEAAEAERAPVVLGFGGMMMEQGWLDRFGIEPLGAYVRTVAERVRVPAATILNEVWEIDYARRGVHAGFGTVMLNTCDLPYEQNRDLTKSLVDYAHAHGVEVQAELGRLPNYGQDEVSALTEPSQAKGFVDSTGVDFLAVSIGNVHLRTEGSSTVDLERLRAIRQAVDIPLVIHGGSGFPQDVVVQTIQEGVALFHVGSVMKRLHLEQTAAVLKTLGDAPDFQEWVGSRKGHDFLIPGKQAIREVVRGHMRRYGCAGKAA
jgi:ketose-bisphosphate aldolase